MALASRDMEKYGHTLVKWYLHQAGQDENITAVIENQNLKNVAMHFCNFLLAAGVLHQIKNKNLPMCNVFQLDLVYCWARNNVTRHRSLCELSPTPCSPKSPRLTFWYSCMQEESSTKEEDLNVLQQKEIHRLEQQIQLLREEIGHYETLLRIKRFLVDDREKFMICGTTDTTEPNENADKILRRDATTQTDETIARVETQNRPNMPEPHFPSLSTIISTPPLFSQMPVIPLPSQPNQRTPENFGTFLKSQTSIPLPPPLPPPLDARLTPEKTKTNIISLSTSEMDIKDLSITVPPPSPMLDLEVSPSSQSHFDVPPLPPFPVIVPPLPSPPASGSSVPIPPPIPSTGRGIPLLPPPYISGDSGPPAPPMPGMGVPAPPPIPGNLGPPPPPMPGMGVPPAPPIPGNLGPPPPPMPGMGIPPPSPIPGNSGPSVPPMLTMGVPPPPPLQSGVIPAPPMLKGPVPFPPAPLGGWNAQKSAFKKPKVDPSVPMKPLYWTRILTASTQNDSYSKPALWVEVDELPLENLSEFEELFSRQVIKKKPNAKKEQHPSKLEPVKLLDCKRSRNVGILAQSLRVDIQEIEDAIYNCDTSSVSFEALQQIYEARATDEELELIKTHKKTKSEAPLDKPEQFLYHLSEISHFAERISCLMFQVEFDDSISAIEHTLNNMKTTCEHLMENPYLKDVMAITLTLGNYMNGGNLSRGQADGFDLEILSKLRDVKSKDSKITLLHFIVKTYLKKIDNPLEPNLPLPVPESDDIQRAASVNFDDTKLELEKLLKKLEDCETTSRKIIDTSSQEHLQPFKDRIVKFLDQSNTHALAQLKFLEDCRRLFEATMRFYLHKPKTGTLETATPDDFFKLWYFFSKDFKDIYKMELIKLQKQKIEQILIREHQRTSAIKKIKMRPDGLKAKVKRLRQIKEKEREEREQDY